MPYRNNFGNHDDQTWLDGLFMVGPASVKYANLRNDTELLDIALAQPIVMWEKLRDEKTGLLRHAWDENKKAPWADKETGLSKFVWSRAIGWYAAAIMEMYEAAPKEHKDIPRIREITKDLFVNIIKYQAECGRWYQIVDKTKDYSTLVFNNDEFN